MIPVTLSLSFIISNLHVVIFESLTMQGLYIKFLPFSGQVWIFMYMEWLSALSNLSGLLLSNLHFCCAHHRRIYTCTVRRKAYPVNSAERVKCLWKMVCRASKKWWKWHKVLRNETHGYFFKCPSKQLVFIFCQLVTTWKPAAEVVSLALSLVLHRAEKPWLFVEKQRNISN